MMDKTEIQVIKDNLENFENRQKKQIINFLVYLTTPTNKRYEGKLLNGLAIELERLEFINRVFTYKYSCLCIKFGQQSMHSYITQKGIDWLKKNLEN